MASHSSKEYKAEWKKQNREKVAAYQAKWRATHGQTVRKCRREYDLRHPERKYAWSKVYWAVKQSLLSRQPCEVCGSLQSQAHHEDYSKPLSVRWLCRCHHVALTASLDA